MSSISSATTHLTEYDALVSAARAALEAIPGAVYICDSDGLLVSFNTEAAHLWGREPRLLDPTERFCGSFALFRLDGTPLAREATPMATALRTGEAARNLKVVMERPDHTRIVALVNIRALRDKDGRIQGAINCFQDITVQEQQARDLIARGQDLDDFFENSAIGLHVVAADGTILRANRAELDLLGYSAEEYIGRPIREFHVDDQTIDGILTNLSCGEPVIRRPARLRAKDGSLRHVQITSNSRVIKGKFVSTRCFTMDFTQQQAAETARRETEERLAATYRNAPVGIAETDRTGRFISTNPALASITGYSPEELSRRSFMEITHPDDGEDAEKYRKLVAGELDTYTIVKRYVRKDGSTVPVQVYSSSVTDPEGRFQYGIRIVQDITERKRMQDQLLESEHRLRELLDNLPAALYTTDQEGRITFFNKAAVELSGRTPELGSDRWCVTWRLFWPDGTPLPHDECPMAVALKEQRPVRGLEAIAERPDGSRVAFLPYPTPLRNAKGEMVGGVNMLVDITERKASEQRLKILVDELNHRVKNTLATVQSLAYQTARHASELPSFVVGFETRLMALSRAHDLLTSRHWQGANLQDILAAVVRPFSINDGRITFSGSRVDLAPQTAVSLTLAFNELATNAAKYGSLSAAHGSLEIKWDVSEQAEDQPTIHIGWTEADGPPVIRTDRKGFGSKLLRACIEGDLKGSLQADFRPEGFRCRISVPLRP